MKMRYGYLTLVLAFLLGSRDGFIALWKLTAPEPVYIFPYSIASLPPEDRRKLDDGIRVETHDELMRLLEDYLS